MPLKSKAQLVDFITEYITSNVNRRVTPEDIRTALIDLIDSVHILTSGETILSNNLSSPITNNTVVGEESMPSVIGSGNTSVGYASSHCNLVGYENTSLGISSLENNISGDLNVAVGAASLIKNKRGNNNIGIGAYAGYYIGENDSNQLFIGSHPIDMNFVSTYPSGHSTVVPLMRGDLSNLRLAIGTNTIHTGGTLQVKGNVTPSQSGSTDTLGTNTYVWDKIFVNQIDSDGSISLNKSLTPSGIVDIGASGNEINTIRTKNLFVTQTATINSIVNTTSISAYNKRITLATSGTDPLTNTPKHIFTDEQIDGGGLYIVSSGTGYNREYGFSFSKPDFTLTDLVLDNVYSRAHWNSDISISTDPGNHVMTDAIRGRDKIELRNNNNNHIGVLGDDYSYFGNYYDPYGGFDYSNSLVNSHSFLSAIQNIAYPSGDSVFSYSSNYIPNKLSNSLFCYSTPIIKANGIQFTDIEAGSEIYFLTDPSGLKCGLFPFTDTYDSIKAAFNVYLKDNSNVRFSSISGPTYLELSANGNDLNYGFQLESNTTQTKGSLYYGGNKVESFILESGEFNLQTPLRIKSSLAPSGELGYGSIYVTPATPGIGRSESIFFKDGSGNIFDLLSETQPNKFNSAFVYTDANQNTVIGENVDRNFIQTVEFIAIGKNDLRNYGLEEQNILIGNNLSSYTDDNSVGRLLIGYQDNYFISSKIYDGNNLGYLKIQDELIIRSSLANNYSTSLKQLDDGVSNLILKKDAFPDHPLLDFVNITSFIAPSGFSHQFSNDIPALNIKGHLNLHAPIRFWDGTSIQTASGIPTIAGNGIALTYNPGTKLTTASLDMSNITIDNNGQFGYNSNILIESSGNVKRTPISQLSQFVNHLNPQMFYECGLGYNLVVSNNTAIDHSKNCNNIFIGSEAGDQCTWFTNSVILGPQSAKDAYVSNVTLAGDISFVSIGHRTGRNSANPDNSVFIGPSAGEDSDCANDSIFIGNSAGHNSGSSKSIGIGDNALEGVRGYNNLEILPDKDLNKLLNGTVFNKVNICGIVAGDSCAGRVSVGGASRVFPGASLEVSANSDDDTVDLQQWYNSNGDLVAYLDQNGNLVLKGTVIESQIISGKNNKPVTISSSLACGNQNTGGNMPPVVTINLNNDFSNDFTYSPQGYMLNYTMLFQEE